MHDLLRAQGLDRVNGQNNKRITIVIKPGMGSFAVKNWQKTGVSPRTIIEHGLDAGVAGNNPRVLDRNLNQAADAKGVPGQGNSPNPPSRFGNHYILKANNKLYDPSYGLGPYTDQKAYEDAAFDGSIVYPIVGRPLLHDLPPDNNDAEDHADEINTYTEEDPPNRNP